MSRIDTYSAEGSLLYLAHQAAKTECCFTHRREGLETAHIVHIGMGGNRKKPNPRHFTTLRWHYTVHRNHHRMTSKEFFTGYGINVWEAVGRQLADYLGVMLPFDAVVEDWEGFTCILLGASVYNGTRRVISKKILLEMKSLLAI